MIVDHLILPLLASFTFLPFTLAVSSNFTIYAYGTGVLGLPLFYSEGNAQLGNISAISGYNVSDVYFSIENGDLLAYPNVASTQAMKLDANYTWTSLQLSIPVNGGSSNAVTFTREASSSGAAGEWQFWGPYIFLYDSSKQLVSHFFSEPTNDTGVFNLLWNLSEEQQAENPSAVPVSLRTIAPLDGN